MYNNVFIIHLFIINLHENNYLITRCVVYMSYIYVYIYSIIIVYK